MNLYMPVYKRLENEVIFLTSNILFDDNQLNVYSLAIGDIIVRCAVEIEAISKELYVRLGGLGNAKDLYFDTDCIQLLVDKWNIDEKKIQITNPNMYFSPAKSLLTPLHKANKRGSSGSKWKQAYQAIKHDRTHSIKQATINNMLQALGALYILNLYYADENFWFETPIEKRRKYTVSSEIFTPDLYDATKTSINMETNPNTNNPSSESIFILKYTDEAFNEMQKAMCKMNIRTAMKIQLSKEYQEYISQHPEKKNASIGEIASLIGVDYEKIFRQDSWIFRKALQGLSNQEVILNKNAGVYPMFSFQDFWNSDEGKNYVKHLEENPRELENIIMLS